MSYFKNFFFTLVRGVGMCFFFTITYHMFLWCSQILFRSSRLGDKIRLPESRLNWAKSPGLVKIWNERWVCWVTFWEERLKFWKEIDLNYVIIGVSREASFTSNLNGTILQVEKKSFEQARRVQIRIFSRKEKTFGRNFSFLFCHKNGSFSSLSRCHCFLDTEAAVVKNSGVHSCEVEPEPTSLRGGLQFFLDDGKVQLLAHDQLLAVVSGPLQVGGEEGGIDGFEPLSLQDRKPPKHRMYHHQFSLSTHACVCACVTVCEGDCVLPSKCMSASASVRAHVRAHRDMHYTDALVPFPFLHGRDRCGSPPHWAAAATFWWHLMFGPLTMSERPFQRLLSLPHHLY